MHVLHNFFGVVGNKHNSLPFGPMQASSPSTKELHDLTGAFVVRFRSKQIVNARLDKVHQ